MVGLEHGACLHDPTTIVAAPDRAACAVWRE
jgi:hypothetical protein